MLDNIITKKKTHKNFIIVLIIVFLINTVSNIVQYFNRDKIIISKILSKISIVVFIIQTITYMFIYNKHTYSLGILVYLIIYLVGNILQDFNSEHIVLIGLLVNSCALVSLWLINMLYPYISKKKIIVYKFRKWHISILSLLFIIFIFFFTLYVKELLIKQYNNILEIIVVLVNLLFSFIAYYLSISRIHLKIESKISVVFNSSGIILLSICQYIKCFELFIMKITKNYLLYIIPEVIGLFLISISVIRNWRSADLETYSDNIFIN